MMLNSALFWSDLEKKVQIANMQVDNGSCPHNLDLILRKMFFGSKISVNTFGSRFLGVARESSDLDIYVDIDDNSKDFSVKVPAKVFYWQSRIAKAIKEDENWIFNASVKARCPIVKAIYKPQALECDISCSSGIAFAQNKLVKYLFELQPIARYMVVYLRDWIRDCDLQENFRSHVIILMVIYFLQLSKHLPGIKDLQKNLLPSVGPWVATFNKLDLSSFQITQIIVDVANTRQILRNFFEYYSTFDFSLCAICPYLGTPVKRCQLQEQLPKSFNRRDLDKNAAIILDMYELNNNKGHHLKESHIISFKKIMEYV